MHRKNLKRKELQFERQKCIDKLCKEITGMTFFQLNQGDQYEEYRFADEYSYKEIFVDEKK